MLLYRDSIERVASDAQSELATFWLRKTSKPVLAVLVAQKGASGKRTFYRGLNLEVSMPTGSLCAERNAIGNALAADPTLTRQDLRLVAVLSLNKLVVPLVGGAAGGGGPGDRGEAICFVLLFCWFLHFFHLLVSVSFSY